MTEQQQPPQPEPSAPAQPVAPTPSAPTGAPMGGGPLGGAPMGGGPLGGAPMGGGPLGGAPMGGGPMGGGPQGGRPPMRKRREFKGKYTPRRKVCTFCADKTARIDYKEAGRLRRFISDRGKIEPRRKTGTCAKHQRKLGTALKRARFLALIPYTAEHVRIMGGPPLGRG